MRAVLALLLWVVVAVAPAATNESAGEEAAGSRNIVEAWKVLQAQQQATQRAVEESRALAETLALRQQIELENRLRQLEQTLTEQRARELAAVQESHRFTLVVVGLVAGAGFLGLLVVVWVVVRNAGRRSASVTVQPVGGPAFAQLPGGETEGLTVRDPTQAGQARLRAALERLETRLNDLESVTEMPAAVAAGDNAEERAARVALLLGKGQTLLNLQQTDTALACFDEVIALDPTNAEAFVKKGATFEKLGRLEEAIQCYDRAIALDQSMTMAYLGKGGVFNRLERYSEALQCYEQALRAQQKAGL